MELGTLRFMVPVISISTTIFFSPHLKKFRPAFGARFIGIKNCYWDPSRLYSLVVMTPDSEFPETQQLPSLGSNPSTTFTSSNSFTSKGCIVLVVMTPDSEVSSRSCGIFR